jgi:hypothetical protein
MRRVGLGLLVLGLLASVGLSRADEVVKDLWYVAYGCGKPIGYAHTYVYAFSKEGNLLVETRTVSKIRIAQYGLSLNMSAETKILEDSDGRIISFELRSDNDGAVTEAFGSTEGGILRITSTVDGRSLTLDADISGTLGPFAAWKRLEMDWLEPGRIVEYRALLPELFRVCDVRVEVKGKETTDLTGGEESLWRVETTVSGVPYATVEWCDDSCAAKKSFTLMFGGVTLCLSDKETALAVLQER